MARASVRSSVAWMLHETGFSTVVIGVDGAAGGRDAFVLLSQIAAAATRVEFVGVAVKEPHNAWTEGPAAGTKAEEQGVRFVEELRRRHPEAEVSFTTTTEVSVAAGLTEVARRHDADLIVVGSSGRGALRRVLLGDTTQALLRHAPCAVAVAPKGLAEHPGVELSAIGVGYGEDAASRRALTVARALEPAGGTLSVTRMIKDPHPPMNPALATTTLLVDAVVFDTRTATGAADVAQALPGVDEAQVVIGSVHGGLLELAGHVDLLVVGLHDRSPIGRLLHGRTAAERLLHDLPCPLLALPEQRALTVVGSAAG